jgi:hypothetical protein
MSFFNPNTQGYIDNALNTLQIWFGTKPQQPTQGQTGGVLVQQPRPKPQPEEEKNKTLTYVAIGAGVIVIGLTTFLIIKKRNK